MVAVGLTVLLGSIWLGRTLNPEQSPGPGRDVGGEGSVATEVAVIPSTEDQKHAKEWAMVVFLSSSCSACRSPWLPTTIRGIRDSLILEADRRGVGFKSVGVVLDTNGREGVSYLDPFGAFDEISVGGGPLNHLAAHYFWNELPGVAATPSIVLVEHEIGSPPQEFWEIKGERILVRKAGLTELRLWQETGVHVPQARTRSNEE